MTLFNILYLTILWVVYCYLEFKEEEEDSPTYYRPAYPGLPNKPQGLPVLPSRAFLIAGLVLFCVINIVYY